MRARNIKPGFYKNEDLAACSLMARFIVPGLWMIADRNGRLEDRPMRIKVELLPYEDADVESLLEELENSGHLKRYEVDGEKYIQIIKFQRHQSPHKTEKQGAIPPIPLGNGAITVGSRNNNGGSRPDSLIPDSLIPDSLIPDSLIPDAELPPWVDLGVWEDFKCHRKQIKKPLTDRASNLVLSKLDDFRANGHDPNECLRNSVMNGWAGVFEPKGKPKTNPENMANVRKRYAEEN